MSFIKYLQVLLLGDKFAPKYDLHKKQGTDGFILRLNRIVERNFYVISLAFIILLFLVFVWACFAIVGLSAVDSGVTYNHMAEVI